MFLSRVELPWEAARNPYDMHRQLWRLFPGEARESRVSGEAERQGFLFRIERNPTGCPACLLVQSRRAPEPAVGIALVATREFHPRPTADQRLAFLLTANPVKSIVDIQREAKPDKQSGKCRVPLIKEDDQLQWLARKVTGAGAVAAVRVLPHTPTYFRKGNRSGKLVTVTFEGVLNVTGPDNLIRLLENGVGPAKAFGCGLLLIRRMR